MEFLPLECGGLENCKGEGIQGGAGGGGVNLVFTPAACTDNTNVQATWIVLPPGL